MKKLIILAGLSGCLFQACSKEKEENAVLIRVNNQTDRQLTDVKVFSFSENGLADEEKRYGNVVAGSSSFYQAHHTVFNLPLFEFIMTGSENLK